MDMLVCVDAIQRQVTRLVRAASAASGVSRVSPAPRPTAILITSATSTYVRGDPMAPPPAGCINERMLTLLPLFMFDSCSPISRAPRLT